MDDVPEQDEPEDVVQRSPRLNQDGEGPDGHAQLASGGEERTDAGIEADAEHAEPDSWMLAGVEPPSDPAPGAWLCLCLCYVSWKC